MPAKLYSVKDILAGVCMPPVIFDNDRAAIRAFGDAVTKGDTPLSQHPSDFVIMYIGDFDREHGVLTPADTVVLAHGEDFAKPSKE